MLKKEIIKKITRDAISLERLGINDLAWQKEDVIKLINEILNETIGILGGDVYKLTLNDITHLTDNWSCEPTKQETEEEFYLRSKFESLKYIENYPIEPGEKIIFSLTFTERVG